MNGIESKPVEYARPPTASKYQDQSRIRNFHTATTRNKPRITKPPSSLCSSLDHGLWFYKQFYEKGVDRWQIAKERNLCFRCLASDHRGKTVERPAYVESMVALEIITAFFLEVKCWQKPDR